MNPGAKVHPDAITPEMIAPCGMDCVLCAGFLRAKNTCHGCNGDDAAKPNHCRVCAIKFCEEHPAGGSGLCHECAKFPCKRLRALDKRYREKYRMSMIENLRSVGEVGLEPFAASERERWTCPECGGVECVHEPACVWCGRVAVS